MLKNTFAAIVVSFVATHTMAADLFPEGNLRDIKSGDFIQSIDVVGGYPIFQNDGKWKYSTGRASTSTGGSDTVKMGTVQLEYLSGGYTLARQNISVNTTSGSNSYWSGTPCSSGHLVIRDKGRGRQDNCMTIDAQSVNTGSTATTFLNIVLTNSGSGGRYYRINLSINPDLLGIRNTGLGDWSEEELKAKPYKKQAIEKLTAWADHIQDASIKAFDYSKPQDVYMQILPIMTLLPVPEDLVGQKRSISFISAVEHLRHVETIKSIAYSPWEDYKGSWGFVTEQPSQELADKAAIAKCENNRTTNRPDAPPCEVYRLTDAKRVSDTYNFK